MRFLSVITLLAAIGCSNQDPEGAAPNPYPKPLRADRALLHKISMAIATAGMVTQLVLGPISAPRPGTTEQRHLSIAHLGVGYLSFAAMAVGTLSFVF